MAQMSDEVMSEELTSDEPAGPGRAPGHEQMHRHMRQQASARLIAQLTAPLGSSHPAPAMAWHGKTFDELVASRWRGQGWLALHLPDQPRTRHGAF